MKSYFGFARDHSSSMQGIARAAMNDYNGTIASIREAAISNNQDAIISVVRFGSTVSRELVNSNIQVVQPITHYPANGMTALWDSIWELMDIMEAAPDANDPEVSFVIQATTDGEENQSTHTIKQLLARMQEKVKTDRWSFAFRVPKGGARNLISNGIPAGNILEWDTTERGMAVAQQANVQAYSSFMRGRSAGVKSTTKFYANLEDVTLEDVQKELTDISDQVQFYPVTAKDDQALIRPFIESKINGPMVKGGCFYQLAKLEDKVQATKRLAIQHKVSGAVYSGDAARQLLALPTVGTVKLAPDALGEYNVYIQSTSVNRKLNAGTNLMYWPAVGTNYKTGVSAQ